MLDVDSVRAQFPALHEAYNGKPAIFLDNPGGTQVPRRVIEAMTDYLTRRNANTHGVFETSRRTDATIDHARQAAADLLGADTDEVVFGNNMTSLTFALSHALAREFGPGDEIVVTRLDHDANVSPWVMMAEDAGATVQYADVDMETCTLDMEHLRSLITPATKLVAVGYASNASGTINDVKTIIGWAKENKAYTFIDAVQYAPHGLIDVKALDCDFLACSAYKFFGPHVGILYGKRAHMNRLRAYHVRPAGDLSPDKWEQGTKNHEGLAGVAAAIDYLAELGVRYGHASAGDTRREQAGRGLGRDRRLRADADRPADQRAAVYQPRAHLRPDQPQRLAQPRGYGLDPQGRHDAGAVSRGPRRREHLHVERQLLRAQPERAPGRGTQRRPAAHRPGALQHPGRDRPLHPRDRERVSLIHA